MASVFTQQLLYVTIYKDFLIKILSSFEHVYSYTNHRRDQYSLLPMYLSDVAQ